MQKGRSGCETLAILIIPGNWKILEIRLGQNVPKLPILKLIPKMPKKIIPEITWSLVKFYRLLTCSIFCRRGTVNIAIGAVMFGGNASSCKLHIDQNNPLLAPIVQFKDIKRDNPARSATRWPLRQQLSTSHLRRIPRLIVTFWRPMPQPMRVHICSFFAARPVK